MVAFVRGYVGALFQGDIVEGRLGTTKVRGIVYLEMIDDVAATVSFLLRRTASNSANCLAQK
jgi:hypothetical protein